MGAPYLLLALGCERCRSLNISRFVVFLTWQNFFRDAWNIFDFVSVLGSITDILVTEFGVSAVRCLAQMNNKEWFVEYKRGSEEKPAFLHMWRLAFGDVCEVLKMRQSLPKASLKPLTDRIIKSWPVLKQFIHEILNYFRCKRYSILRLQQDYEESFHKSCLAFWSHQSIIDK